MRHHSPLLLGLLLLAGCASAPASDEARIKAEIAAANRCETTADCVDVGATCPFGCNILVHKDEAGRIRQLVDSFNSQCVYSCLAISGVQCIENRCEAIQEPLPPPSEEEAKGNVGAACTSDAECVTPMDYLVRSSCPFTSLCIEGACAVVCPMWEHDPNPEANGSQPVQCIVDADCDCKQFPVSDEARCSCVKNECVAIVKQ